MRALTYLRPLLPSWRDYRSTKRTWRGDLLAGVTVGIVALPLALAFGVSSGAGAEAGLVTAIGLARHGVRSLGVRAEERRGRQAWPASRRSRRRRAQ